MTAPPARAVTTAFAGRYHEPPPYVVRAPGLLRHPHDRGGFRRLRGGAGEAQRFADEVGHCYQAMTGLTPHAYLCTATNGAGVL